MLLEILDEVRVLFSIQIKNDTIVVDEFTRGSANLLITVSMDMEVNWMKLEIMSSVSRVGSFLVVCWDNISGSKMNVEVPSHGSQAECLSLLKSHAAVFSESVVIKVTPCSSWEIEVSLVLAKSS